MEQLLGAVFEGDLVPPGAAKCELEYHFQTTALEGPLPAEVKGQRKELGWSCKADVLAIKAACSIPVLGIDAEEVVVSVDPPGKDGSRRLLLQSLLRPDLGLTVLRLEADGKKLLGGDETWEVGQPPIICATLRAPAPHKPPNPAPGVRRPPGREARPAKEQPAPAPAPAPAQPQPPARPQSPVDARMPLPVGDGAGAVETPPRRGPDALQEPRARDASENFQRPDLVMGKPGQAFVPSNPGATGDLDQDIRAATAEQAERLLAAAVAGETGDVRQLVARIGTDLPAPSGRHEGLTPLMAAADRGRTEVVSLLLEQRAALEARDPSGWTAVMHAVRGQRPDALRLLLDAGAKADVAANSDEKATALMLAASGARHELVTLLVARGAGTEKRDEEGCRALHYAARKGNGGALVALLAARASVDAPAGDGLTPLLAAAATGRAESVRTLLANHASLAAKDVEGRSARDLAKIYEHDRVLRVLADAGGA